MASDEGGSLGSIIKAGAEVASEVAKAEQEQQKTYQIGLDLMRRAGTFLNGVFGPASQEFGHLLGDQMKYWRFKNAVSILEKAQVLIEERGLQPTQVKALGFGDGLRLLEAASLEEDESVQDMWARLMANAVDPGSATRPEKMYVDILKSLSNREVVFLDLLAHIDRELTPLLTMARAAEVRKKVGDLAETRWRHFSTNERNTSIQNLVRLRCVAPRYHEIDLRNLFARAPGSSSSRDPAMVDPRKLEQVMERLARQQLVASGVTDYNTESRMGGFTDIVPEAAFTLTSLGRDLLRACQAPEAARPG
jgi:hypothetical protein